MAELDPRTGTPGTISGFDSITLADGSVITEANFSIEQLRKLLAGLESTYSLQRISDLTKQMMRHKADMNNPHRTTLAQLEDGDLGAVLKRYVPGTTPQTFPIVAIQASYEDGPQILSSIEVARAGSINVIDRQGFLKYCGPNTSAVDWSLGYPVIPCWPEKNQYVADTTMLNNTTITTTGCSKQSTVTNLTIPSMSASQVVLVETGGQSKVCCTVSTKQLSPEVTASLMLYPTKLTGSYYITTPYGSAVFDVGTKAVTYTDPGIIGHIHVYPNGWWRIGCQALPSQVQQSFVYDVGYTPRQITQDTGFSDDQKVYVGAAGTPICGAANPQVTSGPGLAPFTTDSVIAGTKLTIPGFADAMPTTSGIINFGFSHYPSLAASSEILLAVDNNITMTCDSNGTLSTRSVLTSLPIASSPITITTAQANYPAANSENLFAISYSLNKIAARITGALDRTEISGRSQHFTAMGKATKVTINSFNGGLTMLSLYSFPDDNRTIEFLIGEDR